MVEGTIRSFDPVAYHVNNVSDLDKELVAAFKENDQNRLKRMLSQAKYDYDVFICINKGWHAFLLCVSIGGSGPKDPLLDELMPDADKKPFDVPEFNFCYTIELMFDNVALKTYKIKKVFSVFKDVKNRILRSYYVGRYKGTSPYGLELATLRAAPHRFSVLLDDCVEFAKEFCIQLLAYADNWREIEEVVHTRITKAAATGLSIETLSRRVQSSALIGNTFLGGLDISSLLSRSPNSTVVVLVIGAFVILYPIFVTLVLIKILT